MKYSQMEDNLSWTCDFLQSQTSRKRGCVWKSQEELVPSLHALLAVRRPRVLSLCPGGPWEGGKRSHWDGQAKPGEAQENKEEEEKEVRSLQTKRRRCLWRFGRLQDYFLCVSMSVASSHLTLSIHPLFSSCSHSFSPCNFPHSASPSPPRLTAIPTSFSLKTQEIWRESPALACWRHQVCSSRPNPELGWIWNLNNRAIVRISVDQW